MSQNWNPLQDLLLLQDRMNRLFEDATQRRTQVDSDSGTEFQRADWTPLADIYETETDYLIAIDIPGIERDELTLDVADNRLIVKGTRVVEETNQQRTERPHGKFLRTFGVPGSVDQANIGAVYKDGVLKVRLPKRKEQKAKKVEIKIS
jgi:HSP20 family protein